MAAGESLEHFGSSRPAMRGATNSPLSVHNDSKGTSPRTARSPRYKLSNAKDRGPNSAGQKQDTNLLSADTDPKDLIREYHASSRTPLGLSSDTYGRVRNGARRRSVEDRPGLA